MAINQFSHNSNEPLQVKDLNVSGTETIQNIRIGVASISSLSGTAVTYTTGKFDVLDADTINANGNLNIIGTLYDKTNRSGNSGEILVSTGSGVTWSTANSITIDDDNLTAANVFPTFVTVSAGVQTNVKVSSKRFVFNPLQGRVGIGTNLPADSFQVGTGFTVSDDGTVKALKYFGDGSNLTGLVPNTISTSSATTPQFIGFSTISSGVNTSFFASPTLVFVPGNSGVGSLGIGTTSPTNTLHVQGDVRITGSLIDRTGSTGNTKFLKSTGTGIEWSDSTANVGVATTSSTATQFLTFVLGTGNTSVLGIGTAGSLSFNPSNRTLGVSSIAIGALVRDAAGTWQPTDGFALKYIAANNRVEWGPVVSSVPVSGAAGVSGQVQFNNAGGFAGASNFNYDVTTGNVGIGTSTNLTQKLIVQGNVNVSGILSAKELSGDGTKITGINTGSAGGSPGQVQFNKSGLTSGAQYFHFDDSKISVGIGTSVPSGRLSIANTSTGNSLLLVNDNLNDGSLFRVNDNSGLTLFDVDGGGTILMPITGNVGIGTTVISPTSKLQVGGSMFVDGNAIITGILTAKVAGTITGAAGTSGQVQVNVGGAFTGAKYFHYNDSTISVGIGTSVPSGRLSIASTSTGNSLLLVNDNLSDGSLFRVNDNSGLTLFDADASGTIIMPTSGNVGIGSTVLSPTSKLHVGGTMLVDGNAIITGILTARVAGTITGAAGTSGQVQVNVGGAFTGAKYFHYNDSTISVGIGTSVPTGRLSIANTSTGNSLLLVNDNISDGALFRVADANANLVFDVDSSGTILMPITGNVGIGTTVLSPTSKLQVGGSMFVDGNAIITGILTARVAGTVTGAAGTSGQVQVNVGGAFTGAKYFHYDDARISVGIGTSVPSGRLSIANTSTGTSLLLVNDNISDGALFRVADANANLVFDVDSSGTIIMPTSGNVGIGSTVLSPTSKLQVGGSMFVDGNAIVTGILTARVAGTVTGAAGTSGQVQVNVGGAFTGAKYFHYDDARISVGIGTSVPTGRLSIANTSTGNSLLLVNDNISDGSLLRVADSTGKILFDVDSGGTIITPAANRFGIGTFYPSQSFQVGSGKSAFVVSGVGSVGIGTDNPIYPFSVATNTVPSPGLSDVIADFTTSTNSYSQINTRNTSNGANASSDIVVTADTGTNTTNYIDLGINNSGYSVAGWTINNPLDGYLYTSDTNLSIGAAGLNRYVSIFTGGTLAANERLRVNTTGVGIGTTNPQALLQVGTAFTVTSTGIVSAFTYFGDGSNLKNITGAAGSSVVISTATTPQFIGFSSVSSGLNTSLFVSSNLVYVPSGIGSLGIGTANPTTTVSIGGTLSFIGNNIKIGDNTTGKSITSGKHNFFAGVGAGCSNTTGTYNNFFGLCAGFSNNANNNNFFGFLSGCSNTTGSGNNFFGNNTGIANTTGSDNNFFGQSSGRGNTTGSGNNFFGFNAGCNNTTASSNTFIGFGAGRGVSGAITGSNNIGIGTSAGSNLTSGFDNTFIGRYAGCSNTTGTSNVAIGVSAGRNNFNGNFNNFIGDGAGRYNTSGCHNNFFGSMAGGGASGGSNNSGSYNNFFGACAGLCNNSGLYNNFFGKGAGRCNTSGSVNVYFGVCAGFCNSTNNHNTMIGQCAGFFNNGTSNFFVGLQAGRDVNLGSHNVYLGSQAGQFNTSGSNNVAIGNLSAFLSTSGSYNTFFGNSSGRNNTGSHNTFIGIAAGICNTSGNNNTFIGAYSGCGGAGGVSGSHNIGIGTQTGRSLTSGNHNTFLGRYAGRNNSTGSFNNFVGAYAGCNATTGSCNIFNGFGAGRGIVNPVTGSSNIAIGSSAGANLTGGTYNTFFGRLAGCTNTLGSCNVIIGCNAQGSSATVSNEVTISNGTNFARFQGAASAWTFTSDQRDKTNIQDLTIGRDFLRNIKSRKFEWNHRNTDNGRGKEASGFIAQEVLEVVEQFNVPYTNLVDTNDENQYTLGTTNLIPIMVNAIKELDFENRELKNRILEIERRVGISSGS